jgi:hypothetical protein
MPRVQGPFGKSDGLLERPGFSILGLMLIRAGHADAVS